VGDGLVNLLWLTLFVVIGFPVALAIELYLRGRPRGMRSPSPIDTDFLQLPPESGIARHMREAAKASAEAE